MSVTCSGGDPREETPRGDSQAEKTVAHAAGYNGFPRRSALGRHGAAKACATQGTSSRLASQPGKEAALLQPEPTPSAQLQRALQPMEARPVELNTPRPQYRSFEEEV